MSLNDPETSVVIMGLGPVGLTMAVAASMNSSYRLIALEKNEKRIELLKEGKADFTVDDEEFLTGLKNHRISGTTDEKVLKDAHIVVVAFGPTKADDKNFRHTLEAISGTARKDALILIISTLPIGTLNSLDISQSLAYAYERITPGRSMLKSFLTLPRTVSGKDETSILRAKQFLNKISSRTEEFTELSFQEAETAKLLENSYRAINIALIHEWTLLAEKSGVNLFSVIDSIRQRTGTHDNIRSPGLGIGGPCLVKDAGFAVSNSFQVDMPFIELALSTSHRMNEHICQLIDYFHSTDKKIALTGMSYRPGISDTRNSPMMEIAGRLISQKKKVFTFDSFEEGIMDCDILVLNQHSENHIRTIYEQVMKSKKKIALIDTSNAITDHEARGFYELGCKLLGVGKGHWKTWNLHQ